MSNKIVIQLLVGIIVMAGIFGLFNSYLAYRKFEKLENQYNETLMEYSKGLRRIKKLEATLKWTQQELDSCVGGLPDLQPVFGGN